MHVSLRSTVVLALQDLLDFERIDDVEWAQESDEYEDEMEVDS